MRKNLIKWQCNYQKSAHSVYLHCSRQEYTDIKIECFFINGYWKITVWKQSWQFLIFLKLKEVRKKINVCNRARDAVISVCHWAPWKQWIWVVLVLWDTVPNPAVIITSVVTLWNEKMFRTWRPDIFSEKYLSLVVISCELLRHVLCYWGHFLVNRLHVKAWTEKVNFI